MSVNVTNIQLKTFHNSLLGYFRRLGFHGGEETDMRDTLFKILFGNISSPSRATRTVAWYTSRYSKFTLDQIQDFLNSTREFKIKKNVVKALWYASATTEYTLLNRYVMKLKRIQDKALASNSIKMYEAYNLLDGVIGSPLQQKLEQIATEIEDKEKQGKLKAPLAILNTILFSQQSLTYLTGMLSFGGWRLALGPLPCVLGPVPLKHVHEIEVARSGKILKFRATGSVFLANQEGGKDAIRIEGTLYKSEIQFLWMVWFLFLYGRGRLHEIDLNNPLQSSIFIGGANPVRQFMDTLITDTNLQKPSYEYHRTFPFVTRNFIIPNCYIETVNFDDKLPHKDVLKYTILLRTYDKPEQFDVHFKDNEEGSLTGVASIGIKNKKYGFTGRIIEFAVNSAWRIINSSGFIADEQEWKLGDASEDNVDTYYDVGADSIASVVFLSIMGMM